MAFPSSPTDGQIHTVGDRAFQWNATLGAWKRYANNGTINWQQYKYVQSSSNLVITELVNSGITETIELSNENNKVLVIININEMVANTSAVITYLFRNSTGIKTLNVHNDGGSDPGAFSFSSVYIDTPGSVGPNVYNIKFNSFDAELKHERGASSMLLVELKA